MKKLAFLFTGFLTCMYAQAQPDTLFPLVKTDTLHVYTDHFTEDYKLKKQPLFDFSHPALKEMNLDTGRYIPLCMLYLNAEKTLRAYLLDEVSIVSFRQVIHLYIYDSGQKKYIFHSEAASYLYIEHATEQTTNTWITDVNSDGIMDIATKKDILDFELENEESRNITGTELYLYVYKNGKYEYDYWDEDVLPKAFVRK